MLEGRKYAFVPDQRALEPSHPEEKLRETRITLPAGILGINDDVECRPFGRQRRFPNLFERSNTSSVESDDVDTTKLQIFQILGELDYYDGIKFDKDKA